MNRTIASVLTIVAILAAAPLLAAEGTRIAVANTARIFSEMQELKDLRAKLQSEQKLLAGASAEKQDKLKAMQAARDTLKTDSPQYQEKNAEWLKAAIEYEAWGKINEADMQRNQKLQMRRLFEKIAQAVAEVAKQKGYDLVLTDQHPDLPDELDRISLDQLRNLINSRNVLYAGEKVDISDDVLAFLDARYRAGAKGQPSAAATTQPK
jgi:Skp family chaperone for outer membrane proteins